MVSINKKIISFFAKNKSVFFKSFLLGALGLSFFYYLILVLVTRDFSHPFQQFLLFQPWMSILIIGFGSQVGFHSLLMKGDFSSLEEKKDAKNATRTSSAVSGVAMVACCAHHMVDLLPIMGISSTMIFLTEYQKEFLIVGVAMNILGAILMMVLIIKKLELAELEKIFITKKEKKE